MSVISVSCLRQIIKKIRAKGALFAAGAVYMLVIFSFESVLAESVFLRDGSIIEGKTVKVSDERIEFLLPDGRTKTIPRRDILRTLFDDSYRTIRYIYLKDGTEIAGYIVFEDSLNYTYRLTLESPEELKVQKKQVKAISSEKLSPGEGRALTPEEETRSRFALLRTGTGFRGLAGSEPEKGNESMVPPLFIDLFFYRFRDDNGNGIDLLARYSFNNYDSGSISENTAYIYDRFGITITPSGTTIDTVKWHRNAFACGLRYIDDFYYNGMLWQWYVTGYYQFSRISLEISGTLMEKYYIYYSHGITAGAGIEAALTPMFGVFAEFTWGYSPAFPSEVNIEGDFLRFGVVLRVRDLM